MEEMTTGLCPKCGHTLQIPAELERFSCMYCGERLTKRQLLTQPEEASCSEEDCAVSFDHAVSRLRAKLPRLPEKDPARRVF